MEARMVRGEAMVAGGMDRREMVIDCYLLYTV
jgi:hypothetical protein